MGVTVGAARGVLMREIGDALLQRYEALERQHQREVGKFERQVSADAGPVGRLALTAA